MAPWRGALEACSRDSAGSAAPPLAPHTAMGAPPEPCRSRTQPRSRCPRGHLCPHRVHPFPRPPLELDLLSPLRVPAPLWLRLCLATTPFADFLPSPVVALFGFLHGPYVTCCACAPTCAPGELHTEWLASIVELSSPQMESSVDVMMYSRYQSLRSYGLYSCCRSLCSYGLYSCGQSLCS
jgi:hypothetical protein